MLISTIPHKPARIGVEAGLLSYLAIQGSSQYLGDVHKDAVEVN
jgi:hypothetical protein